MVIFVLIIGPFVRENGLIVTVVVDDDWLLHESLWTQPLPSRGACSNPSAIDKTRKKQVGSNVWSGLIGIRPNKVNVDANKAIALIFFAYHRQLMLGPEGWRKVCCKFKKFKVGDIKQNDAMIKRLWYTDLSRPWGPNIGPIWTGLGVPVPRVCFAFKKSTQLMIWAMGILIELWDQADTCPLFLASKKSPAAKFQVYSYTAKY